MYLGEIVKKLWGNAAARCAATSAVAAATLFGSVGLTAAPVVLASPSDDNYLAAIEANGVPIFGRDYVIALGHAVCDTARQYPSMQLVDLVLSDLGNENEPSPYSFDQGKVIATSALANYCPDAAAGNQPVAPLPIAPVTAPPFLVPPPTGIPYIPNLPNAPSLDVPNFGCTWVNGYTRKDGTHVRGHYRC